MRSTAVGLALVAWVSILPVAAEPISIEAAEISAFDPRDPGRDRFGELTFLGGLVLSSPDPRFGGISGAEIAAGGDRILLLTDRAHLISADLVSQGDGPAALARARIHQLVDEAGRPIPIGANSDSEALRGVDGAGLGDEVLVAFERNHRVVRYEIDADGAPSSARRMDVPAAVGSLPRNEGLEAVAVMPPGAPRAGAVVMIAEDDSGRPGFIPAWISKAGRASSFRLVRRDDFKVTDAVALASGDVVVLERRLGLLTGLSMRLRRFPVSRIEPDAVIEGEVLMTATMAYEVDNMEALAAHRDGSGRTILTILSDDNFIRFQRTLLLQFALED